MPKDYANDVEVLFRRIADRHRLTMLAVEAPVELLFEIPVQKGLAFEIQLGFQNGFQLDLFAEGLWVEQTFPRERDAFEEMANGLIDGSYRITVFTQKVLGRSYVWKRQLEKPKDAGWKVVFRHYTGCKWPFVPSEITFVSNTAEHL